MAQPWRRVICGPGMQPEGVSVLHSSGVSLHGSKSGASSRVCSSSSAVGAVAAFIYGDPAGSRSDARAASLICGAAAVSEPLSAGVRTYLSHDKKRAVLKTSHAHAVR